MTNEPAPVKQVIVVRADLKMRRGKEVAQGAHAAMKDLVTRIRRLQAGETLSFDAEETAWYLGNFRKVCVRVDSEAELVGIYDRAQAAGLRVQMVEDHGLTEFHGVLTRTCLAIGPHADDRFVGHTDQLKLY